VDSKIDQDWNTFTIQTGELTTCFDGVEAAAEQIALLHSRILELQERLMAAEKEISEDGSWNYVCRFMDALGIKAASWHETTPEQIERGVAEAARLKAELATKRPSLPWIRVVDGKRPEGLGDDETLIIVYQGVSHPGMGATEEEAGDWDWDHHDKWAIRLADLLATLPVLNPENNNT
jgi:hypothetical protein